MTFVSKECEVKTKMIEEQWQQLKMMFLLDFDLKIIIYWRGEFTFGGGK